MWYSQTKLLIFTFTSGTDELIDKVKEAVEGLVDNVDDKEDMLDAADNLQKHAKMVALAANEVNTPDFVEQIGRLNCW